MGIQVLLRVHEAVCDFSSQIPAFLVCQDVLKELNFVFAEKRLESFFMKEVIDILFPDDFSFLPVPLRLEGDSLAGSLNKISKNPLELQN